jgi:hypothetical protein
MGPIAIGPYDSPHYPIINLHVCQHATLTGRLQPAPYRRSERAMPSLLGHLRVNDECERAKRALGASSKYCVTIYDPPQNAFKIGISLCEIFLIFRRGVVALCDIVGAHEIRPIKGACAIRVPQMRHVSDRLQSVPTSITIVGAGCNLPVKGE